MRRSLRKTERIDYKVSHLTGAKQAKEQARVSKVVERLDQALIMEDNKAVDEEMNLRLEILRFYDEYDVDFLEGIDDIREGIAEIKDLTRRYVSVHIELQRALDDQYEEEYKDYDAEVKKMTDWVKLARTTISERRKKEQGDKKTRNQNEKNDEIMKEKAEVKLEEKYFKIKMKQVLLTVDIESSEHVEEIDVR